MTKIQNFINAGGTYNDNSESVVTISPEGTKVEQHLHPQEKPVANDNSVCIESPVYLSDEKGATGYVSWQGWCQAIEERLLYGYG